MVTEQKKQIVKLVRSTIKLPFVVVSFEDSDTYALLWQEKYKTLKMGLRFPFLLGMEVTVNYCECEFRKCPLSLAVGETSVKTILCCVYDDEGVCYHH